MDEHMVEVDRRSQIEGEDVAVGEVKAIDIRMNTRGLRRDEVDPSIRGRPRGGDEIIV